MMELITGIFLGICIALVGVIAFVFIAKRKCWLDIKVAAAPVLNQVDQAMIDQMFDRINDLRDDHEALVQVLKPYLDKESKKAHVSQDPWPPKTP